MPKNFINVMRQEWADAKAYFLSFPDKLKYRKSDTTIGKKKGKAYSHSFLLIDNVIYVVNNTKHVSPEPDSGEGSFSRVKYALTEDNILFVIKVEGVNIIKGNIDDRNAFMLEMGQRLSDSKERDIEAETKRKGELRVLKQKVLVTQKKFYILLKYLGDRDLWRETGLNVGSCNLPQSAALAYMLKVMVGLQRIHNKRIVHADLKPENVMVMGQKPNLTVTIIDFDFSRRLDPKAKKIVRTRACGTPPFIAPEIMINFEYSFASDVFAIGKMLEELLVDRNFYIGLINDDPRSRPTLWKAMEKIVTYLRENLNYSSKNTLLILNALGEYDILMREELKMQFQQHLSQLIDTQSQSFILAPPSSSHDSEIQPFDLTQPAVPTYLPCLEEEEKKSRGSLSQPFSEMHIVTLNLNQKKKKRNSKTCSIQ